MWVWLDALRLDGSDSASGIGMNGSAPVGGQRHVNGEGAPIVVQNARKFDGRSVYQVLDFAAGVNRKRSVVPRIDYIGGSQHFLEALPGLILAPENKGGQAPPDGPGIRNGVASNADQTLGGLYQHADVPPGMAWGFNKRHSRLKLCFSSNFAHLLALQSLGKVAGGRVVSGPGISGVLQLLSVNHNFCVGEQVSVLGVVPMGMGQYHA